ncbi:MAG: PKD domain-containing protein [Bacteroidales bacterium]
MIRINYIYITLLLILAPVVMKGQESDIYEVKKLPVSSRFYNDMAPVVDRDIIYFCSDRRWFGWRNDAALDGRNLYSIYMAERSDSVSYGDVELFSGDLASIADEGPFCFDSDMNRIFFSRTIDISKRARRKISNGNKIGIFIADRTADGWGNVREFIHNDPRWNTGHPSVSSDGRFLYFSSDMTGGQGLSDIYFSENINGEWSEPVNMGNEINSSAADLYPWISPSGELFFASDREGGTGMLDIYSSRFYNGKWMAPVMLPEPVNSPSNDFAYTLGADPSEVYFTSDREGLDDLYRMRSLIVRKTDCNEIVYEKFCYEFEEEYAARIDTLPFEFEWDFDDGSKAKGIRAVHCFDEPGTYIVKLNIIDIITGEVQYNETSLIHEVQRMEQPFIEVKDTLVAGDIADFDASLTNLPGWEIEKYYWNFDDGTAATGLTADKQYRMPGIYNVQLIVTSAPDESGNVRESCVSKIIIVNPEK